MKYVGLIIVFVVTVAFARPITVEDMWAMKRISDVQLSPDGKWLAFSVTQYDMEENSGKTDIWVVPASGGEPRQLTFHQKSSHSPRWHPDGSGIGFLSAREGITQVYFLPLNGGEARAITHVPVDVEGFVWSPAGDKIAFQASVYADAASMQESADRDAGKRASKVKARIIDGLLYRSWNRWTDGKRTHIFICDADGDNVVDATPGDYDAPPLDLGGHQDFVFSPDGQTLAFVSNHTDMPATNTNNDVWLVPITGGEAKNLTQANKAVDNQPCFLPDGQSLVYRAMERPGFEADQYEIVLQNITTGKKQVLTSEFDLSPDEVVCSPDGDVLYFNAREQGRRTIYKLERRNGRLSKLIDENVNSNLLLSPDGKKLYFLKQSVQMPNEIFSYNLVTGEMTQLTFINKSLLDELNMNPVEDFWFTSFDGKKAHGFIVKPPAFDPSKKYPLVYLIHGGPQGMWSDDFHYRWNISMFASPGYVVAAVNFRGSKGYGQEWCDAVSKDWGGGPYNDLMTGLDYILKEFDYIDDDAVVAAGASYGGFMINWIATHTDRFKALVSHSGVFDQRSMYGATEELWFPEWEFNGTPYDNPELYEKWSPSTFAGNFETFKTPVLIFHGQHDYRVPVTQSFQLFTALQRYNVPSRLIYFPDETHFVTKPQNARLWWSQIFEWFDKWLENK